MLRRERRSGQVVVEMLLILPVFMAIVFMIMEIGYVSFRLILLNHATYEAARVGGMTYYPGKNISTAEKVMHQILPRLYSFECHEVDTLRDRQADQMNRDLQCTAREDVQLIFPISSIILSKPKGLGTRRLETVVRMPIEQPLKQ